MLVCTQEIGMSSDGPGVGNTLMAKILSDVVKDFPGIRVLAQHSVALAAKKFGVPITHAIEPPENAYFHKSTENYNSFTVVEEQGRWLREKGCLPVCALVLTSPDHAGRVKKLMERRDGFEELILIPVPLDQQVYLDRNSLYLSVRIGARLPYGKIIFRAREAIARLKFLAEDKI